MLQHFIRWEASKYQISENFTKRFGICQFSSFLVNFGCLFPKNDQKITKQKKAFFVAFSFVGKHLLTIFQKITSTVWILPNFFIFCQFWLFFWPRNAKKGRNRTIVFPQHLFLLGNIYIPNFRKFHQTVWILPIFLIFGQFGCFFG